MHYSLAFRYNFASFRSCDFYWDKRWQNNERVYKDFFVNFVNVYHIYDAGDTQLCVALPPTNYSNELITLQSCLSSLIVWFCENGMALNPSKSYAILFGTAQRLKKHVYFYFCQNIGFRSFSSNMQTIDVINVKKIIINLNKRVY